jgi:Kef-type K+ transport system membrane component KefB/nucleotide-binding universal stress UspA family protein
MSTLLTLLLQIGVILAVARGVGWLFRRIHQPQVVGEMAAGILLGPSLLGWVAPELSASLFPPNSLPVLNTLSQVGLLLFMFLVGLEFDPRLLRGRGHTAVVTSHASIVVPFTLGAALTLLLYPRLSDSSVSFTAFALFMGAAMSVTAFPVLARILTERNLLGTKVGALAIACAAVGDVTAWTILAVVVAIVRSSAVETPLALTIFGTLAFLLVLIFVVRRALGGLESFFHNRGRLTQDMLAAVLLLLLASAWTTEWLGIHALFGAFAAGTVMPKHPRFVHDLTVKLEDVAVVFLLPLFFAFTGLRTSVGLVSGGEMWLYAALILLVAVAGKFGGSTIAARVTGLPWREASAVGVLMNTRGLMELVILTIGFELGVISPALFTMLVFMALLTTAMTTPLLEWIYPERRLRESVSEPDPGLFTALLPVSLPLAGPGLLRTARLLTPQGRAARFYALHLERVEEQSLTRVALDQAPDTDEALLPLLSEAEASGVEVRPVSLSSRNVAKDILEVAREKRANLVVLGWHKPVLSGNVLGGTVAEVMREAPCDVALLLERGKAPWRRILVMAPDPTDVRISDTARRIRGSGAEKVTTLRVHPAERPLESGDPIEAVMGEAVQGYDLVVATLPDLSASFPFEKLEQELALRTGASLLVLCYARHEEAKASPSAKPRAVTKAAS